MISNIPAFAAHQDYQLRHADMLAAARGDVVPPNLVAARRKVNPWIYDKSKRTLVPNPQTAFLNEPTTKHITYGDTNSWLKRIWEDSKHQKGDKWITFHGWDLASKDEIPQG